MNGPWKPRRPHDRAPSQLRVRLAALGLVRCPPVYLPREIVEQISRLSAEHLPTVNAIRDEIRAEQMETPSE